MKSPESEQHQSTILVVDDNGINLKLVAYLLELAGHRVITAMNAKQAQAVLEEILPEMILMDICLPGMDGLTLTRKLRSNEKTRHLTIVALTAAATKGDSLEALAAGCDGYISKPINTRELSNQVAEFLRLTAHSEIDQDY